MPYFPNYPEPLASPYAFLGLNFFNTMEHQMRLMDRLFTEVKKRRSILTFEVTEEANTTPRPHDRTARRLAVHPRQLRQRALVLFQSRGRAHSAAPVVDETAIREASEFPLSDYKIS